MSVISCHYNVPLHLVAYKARGAILCFKITRRATRPQGTSLRLVSQGGKGTSLHNANKITEVSGSVYYARQPFHETQERA